jgi:hypothetical protein
MATITNLTPLTISQILAWADAHERRTGSWPTATCGPIEGTEDETWLGIQKALRLGGRGLSGGDSLMLLRSRMRGPRPRSAS